MRERRYPDAVAGRFETPPITFTDGEGREVEIREYDGTEASYEALVSMYDSFDPSDRAQGIPPGGESRVREWLDAILTDDCLNVVAWCEGSVAGHATLVPDDEAYELAIFVHQTFQRAGIGTRLFAGGVGGGEGAGIGGGWLAVEGWNGAAVWRYEKIGFETSNTESFEREMALRLNE